MSNYEGPMAEDVWEGEDIARDEAEIIASMEQDRVEEDTDYWQHYGYDPVEQGFYDDDPNPYHGDYSEM